jgi:hypothetical protein
MLLFVLLVAITSIFGQAQQEAASYPSKRLISSLLLRQALV